MTKKIVNINGKLVSDDQAHVSVFDRGFLYGDSIYEVTLTYNRVPFLLEEHFDRLWQSAEKMGLDIQWSRQQLTQEIQKGIDALEGDRLYIRLIITRGCGEIGLDTSLAEDQGLFIIYKNLPEYPQSWYSQGVHMIVADLIRNPKEATDPSIKSGNYLNNILALKQAKEKGAFDAIMLSHDGLVTEATTSNIWIVKDQTYITPPLETGLLSGITRKTLLNLGREHGLSMKEQNFTTKELKEADEVFITASTKEIVPVVKVDQETIGNGLPGEMTQSLHELYKSFINNYVQKRL